MGHEEGRKIKKGLGFKIFIGGVCAAVLAAVIAGLMFSGSPESARSRQFDDMRSANLQEISYALEAYFNANGNLPSVLDGLLVKGRYPLNSLKDPKTKENYEYKIIEGGKYELCAVFETDSSKSGTYGNGMAAQPVYPYQGPEVVSFFEHGIGRKCFSREAVKTVMPIPVKY